MILLERLGKAVRSPSKSALLAHVAGAVGRGRGFGVHKALDQVGAFAGPLLVAARGGREPRSGPGMAVLAVPGAIAMVLLLTLRRRVPDPERLRPVAPRRAATGRRPRAPPRGWWAEARRRRPARRLLPLRRRRVADHRRAGDLRHHRLPPHRRGDRPGRRRAARLRRARWRSRRSPRCSSAGSTTGPGARILLVVPVLVALVPALALGPTLAVVLRRGRRVGLRPRRAGLDDQGRGGRPGRGTAPGHGVRRLRRHPGPARDRRRRRRGLALRPLADGPGRGGGDQPGGGAGRCCCDASRRSGGEHAGRQQDERRGAERRSGR